MKPVRIEALTGSEKAAITVYDASGRELVKKGAVMSDYIIEKLRLYSVPFVYTEESGMNVNAVIEPEDVAGLLKVLRCFVESEGQNGEILKRYNDEEIKRFLSYNSEAGKQIAYGHVFKYLSEGIVKKASAASGAVFDFLDYRSQETYFYFHMANTAVLSVIAGARAGLSKQDLNDLCVGAMLFDLKMNLYGFISKTEKLDAAETEEMRQHASMSFDAIRKIYGVSAKSAQVALQHHERIDGSGYPKGLKDEGINFLSKIAAICDVYDALISQRPFRQAYMPDEAWNYISGNAGVIFDQKAADSFCAAVAKYTPGDVVALSDGRTAIIARNNAGNSQKPVIKLIEKKGKGDIIFGAEIDTGKELSVQIIKTIESIRQAWEE